MDESYNVRKANIIFPYSEATGRMSSNVHANEYKKDSQCSKTLVIEIDGGGDVRVNWMLLAWCFGTCTCAHTIPPHNKLHLLEKRSCLLNAATVERCTIQNKHSIGTIYGRVRSQVTDIPQSNHRRCGLWCSQSQTDDKCNNHKWYHQSAVRSTWAGL